MMNFNAPENYARPLGGLQKPGAGAVMVTMSVPPIDALPLLTGMLESAQSAAYAVIGGPDPIANPGMIHEYNLLGMTPGFIAGSYNLPAWEATRANKLASIAEIIRSGWGLLTDFLIDTQEVIAYALKDALEAQSPGGKEAALQTLQYYADELTGLGPQIRNIAAQLDTGGALVEDKIRAFRSDYSAASRSLESTLGFVADLVAVVAEQFRKAAEGLKEPAKWATVAVVGLAVVALAGAAIYFIPRPRGRR